MARGKILLIITHKLHLLQPDDQIIMLINGRLTQFDTLENVRTTAGPFRRLLPDIRRQK
jgi:ABC-type transport system involved in cytochrome bd biosynthesis fused ATPase/permease subunit